MPQRRIGLLDAPSNLGLRPPAPDAVPGCYKLPWALRERQLLPLLGATDAGVVVPPRYHAGWAPGDGTRNAAAIAAYSSALADRVGALLDAGTFPLVLGGDCSILIGNALALRRRGRYGLVFLDAHSDFRHPGNDAAIGAAAGEDLAIVTGLGDTRLVDLESRGPLVRAEDVVLLGTRAADDYLPELQRRGIAAVTSAALRERGPAAVAAQAVERATHAADGFWTHLDLDVVDAAALPAVDSPEPDGLSFAELAALLGRLAADPRCIGLEVTIYDPDLDPAGIYAEPIVRCLAAALSPRAQL